MKKEERQLNASLGLLIFSAVGVAGLLIENYAALCISFVLVVGFAYELAREEEEEGDE